MLIISDYRLPQPALQKLSELGELLLFNAGNQVYESISGHPDIFLCETPSGLLVAPNAPDNLFAALRFHQIPFHTGTSVVGAMHPETTFYNAVVTSEAIIHHRDFTDPVLSGLHPELHFYHVKQSYTRCSLFALDENTFITSDRGIWKALKEHVEIYYFLPENILLPGQKNGFLGGCIGKYGQTIYFSGKIDTVPEYKKLRELLRAKSLDFVELYDGPLIDVGGLLFLK